MRILLIIRKEGFMEINGYRVFYVNSRECIEYINNLIKTTSARKIALVVHNNEVIKNEKNLNLIRETMDNNNKDIIFINPDNELKEIISSAGFIIYNDLQAMENKVAASSEEVENKFPGRFLSLVGIVIIFFLGWIYLYYPAATIVIKPQTVAVRQDIQILASLQRENIDWENNILPLHEFEVTLTDEEEIDATGKNIIGKSRATGNVRFVNEKEEEVRILAGTILLAKNGMKYRTLSDVTVPGMKIDYLMDVQVGRKAGQIEVKVEAVKEGSDGNIPIGSINKLAKPLENIHVINPEPIRGGEDTVTKVVAADDIDKLRKTLAEKIRTRLLNKIYIKLGGNFRLLTDEIEYSNVEYNFAHQVGDAVNLLKGNATIVAKGYLLRNNELDRLVTNIYEKKLITGQKLLSGGVIIKNLKLAEKSDGLYNIIMESTGAVVPGINIDKLTDELRGNNIKTAHRILKEDKKISEYKITTRNESSTLPDLGFAIKVIVEDPGIQQVINID